MQGVGLPRRRQRRARGPGLRDVVRRIDRLRVRDKTAPAPSVYSVETWFKTTTTRGGKLVGYGNGLPNTGTRTRAERQLRPARLHDQRRQAHLRHVDRSAATVTSPPSYNDGQWHQVVATQGAAGMALYVDGVRVGATASRRAALRRLLADRWRQPHGWPSQPSSYYFAGQLDETAVYPTALSGLQVEQHYVLSGRTPAVHRRRRPTPTAPRSTGSTPTCTGVSTTRPRPPPPTPAATASPARYSGAVSTGDPGVVPGGTKKAATFTPTGSGNGQGGVIGSDTQFTDPHDYSLELWFSSTTGHGGKLHRLR